MNRALRVAQTNLYSLAIEAKQQMLVVEGDGNLASLQGFCAGADLVKTLLGKSGLEVVTRDTMESFDIDTATARDLQEIDIDVQNLYSGSPEWKAFLSVVQQDEQEKKDYLYNEAKKGRDLAYVQGWKKAVTFMIRFFNSIQEKLQDEQGKGATFDF